MSAEAPSDRRARDARRGKARRNLPDEGEREAPPLIDLRGEVCPYTFVRCKLRLEELPLGATLEILVDHPAAATNVPRSLAAEGQEVVAVMPEDGAWRITAIKRTEGPLRARSGS